MGLSIDGPREIHHAYRRHPDGRGSFDRVMQSARLLNEHGVRFATLTVVNDRNAGHPLEVYRFLRDEVKSRQMQFIPIVEPRGFAATAPQFWDPAGITDEDSPRVSPSHPESFVEPWCVEPEQCGDFLIKVFDEWHRHDFGQIYVRSSTARWNNGWDGRRRCAFFRPSAAKGSVEHNGDVYSCDHYVYPEYRLGNIGERLLVEMALSQWQEDFGYGKDRSMPSKCRMCRYLFACSGECPKNRLLKTRTGEAGLNYLCRGLYKYFSHIDLYIRRIVNVLGHEIADDVPPLI